MTRVNQTLGISDEWFAMGDSLILTVLGQVCFLTVFCSLYGVVKNDLLLKEIGTNNHMNTYFWGDWLHRIGMGDLLYKVWQAEWYRKCHSLLCDTTSMVYVPNFVHCHHHLIVQSGHSVIVIAHGF